MKQYDSVTIAAFPKEQGASVGATDNPLATAGMVQTQAVRVVPPARTLRKTAISIFTERERRRTIAQGLVLPNAEGVSWRSTAADNIFDICDQTARLLADRYLSAWWTARRKDTETGIFDWVALLVALGIGAGIMTLGLKVAYSPAPPPAGVPAGMYLSMSYVALLVAAGDVRMLLRAGVLGTKRMARHLWRMCFGLFIAQGVLPPGTEKQGISSFHHRIERTFCPGYPAAVLADFLARASPLHKCIRQNGDSARRRCFLRTDLAFERTSAHDTQAIGSNHSLPRLFDVD